MRAIVSAISLFFLVFFTLPLAVVIFGYLLFTYTQAILVILAGIVFVYSLASS